MEIPPSLSTAEQRPPSSLISRMLNVFAAPGDVFEELKPGKPMVANWLAPVLLGCLMGIVYSVVVFSQDSIIHSMREAQEQAIRTKLQKQVDAGKMSKEQVDQAVEMAQRFSGPTIMKIFGSIGAAIMNFLMVFFVGLVIWLVGAKVFKGQFGYMKAVETAGLAGMINVLGGLVAMLLAVMMGNIAMTPGPVLLVRDFHPANKVHVLLSQLNVMTLWYIAVASVGLGKLSGASFAKAAAWLFGIWAMLVALFTLIRFGG